MEVQLLDSQIKTEVFHTEIDLKVENEDFDIGEIPDSDPNAYDYKFVKVKQEMVQEDELSPIANKSSSSVPLANNCIKTEQDSGDSNFNKSSRKFLCVNNAIVINRDYKLSSQTENTLLHVAVKLFKCDTCQSEFTCRASLNYHMLTHRVAKPFKCEICQREFAHRSSIKYHMLLHRDGKPYQCELCQRRFRQKCHVDTHILSHSNYKQFRCNVCNKLFTRKNSLVRHFSTICGPKPFKCDVCQQAFRQKSQLAVHMLTHSGGKAIYMSLQLKV